MARQPDDETARPSASRLLISEPPLLVLPSLAVAVGLNEAIFLQQLHYWLQSRSAKPRDGRPWVYNTYEEWHQQLPFWSLATLRRIVNGLESAGLVLSTTAYNAHRVDRTEWYTIDYAALERHAASHLPERADHVLNLSRPSGQPEQMQALNLSGSEPETTAETTPRERRFEASKGLDIKHNGRRDISVDPDRARLVEYLADFARELHDRAPLPATVGRALNLYRGSGLDWERFVELLYAARATTKERSAGITAAPVGGGRDPGQAQDGLLLRRPRGPPGAAGGDGPAVGVTGGKSGNGWDM